MQGLSLTPEDVAHFQEHGVVCLRGVVTKDWLRYLSDASENLENNPGPLHEILRNNNASSSTSSSTSSSSCTYFTDLEMAQRLPDFDNFARRGPCAGVAGTLLQCNEVCFLYDQYFRQGRQLPISKKGKKSKTRSKKSKRNDDDDMGAEDDMPSTPWHQDQPYWQVKGKDVVSVWVPLDTTPPGYEVQFISGSHRWQEHSPFHFATGKQYEGTGMPVLPDIDRGIDDGTFSAVSFPNAQPGDCIVFSAMTVHGQCRRQASSSLLPSSPSSPSSPLCDSQFRRMAFRFTGDDARYHPREGEAADVIPSKIFPAKDLKEGDKMESERFPLVWTKHGGVVQAAGAGLKCVIFDLGGVVFSSPIGRLAALETEIGMPSKTLNRFIMNSKAWKRMEKGITNTTTFAIEYDAEVKQGVEMGALNSLLMQVSGLQVMTTIANGTGVPRQQYVEAITSLKMLGIKTVALTNNFKSTRVENQANVVRSMFDLTLESSELGLRKPDPKIYQLACTRANVNVKDCIFLDDIGANLKPAAQLGMQTIRVLIDDLNGVDALHSLEKIVGHQLFVTGRRSKL